MRNKNQTQTEKLIKRKGSKYMSNRKVVTIYVIDKKRYCYIRQITSQKHTVIVKIKGRVAQWLGTCAWKPKVPGSSPAANYVQRWALCSNRPANV